MDTEGTSEQRKNDIFKDSKDLRAKVPNISGARNGLGNGAKVK